MSEESERRSAGPVRLDLEPGTYWWCTCGKTSHGPFCDGSHKGSGMQPKKFEIAKTTHISLCQCRATKNPPLCDGSHRDL